jgi:hypothetical protein
VYTIPNQKLGISSKYDAHKYKLKYCPSKPEDEKEMHYNAFALPFFEVFAFLIGGGGT